MQVVLLMQQYGILSEPESKRSRYSEVEICKQNILNVTDICTRECVPSPVKMGLSGRP